MRELLDEGRQLVGRRLIERRSQRPVTIGAALFARNPPLAAIVDARNARHAKEHAISGAQTGLVGKDTCQARHIVVVDKRQQMFAAVDAPRIAAKLAVQRMGDLEHVDRVKAGVQALVALVVGAGVKHLVIDDLVVVAVERLTNQHKVGLELTGKSMQAAHKIAIEHIGDVQAQAVDAKALGPATHGLKQVIDHGGVLQVELHKLKMAFPALVPKAVAIAGVAVKANVKPVLVGRVPLALLNIAEGPETAAHMVKDGIEHHANAMGVQRLAYSGKIGIPAQAAVDMAQAARIVAVAIRLERRVDQHSANTEFLQVVGPLGDLHDGRIGVGRSVGSLGELILGNGRGVFARSSTKAQRIDLVERRLVCPHSSLPAIFHATPSIVCPPRIPSPKISCSEIGTVETNKPGKQSLFHRN